MANLKIPFLTDIGTAYDDRGFLEFFNDFHKYNIKRFYIINNNQTNFIRAWHAHKKESKIFYCIEGFVQVSAVKIKNFDNPNKKSKVHNFFLSEKKPKLLYIPSGYANGIKFFSNNERVIVFSSSILKDSLNDDYRFDFDFWNPWESNFR